MASATRVRTVLGLGLAQTLAWGSSYYLSAILAAPIARDLQLEPATVFAAFSAGLVVSAVFGPRAGRAIDTLGGRPVLAASSLGFAAGLAALGLASGVWSLFAAWLLIGLAMSAGLYEAAFAALVRLHGSGARNAITGITLIAGFASTVGWPLTTALEQALGWRGACMAWAGLHLLLGLPLNLALPRAPRRAGATPSGHAPHDAGSTAWPQPPLHASVLLALVFALTWFISTAMAAHLPRLLQLCGVGASSALLAATLVGPGQVAGRLLEFGVLRRAHPLLSARLAATLHPVGVLALLLLGAPAALAFALLHGAGNGVLTIAKGTLPLVLFGPQGYGERQGLLMVPARLAQALAPWLFGLVVEQVGARALWLSALLGLLVLLALGLLRAGGPPANPPPGDG